MTESIKKLCLDIVKADTQEDIKNILEKKGLWDEENWFVVGGDDDYANHGIIGNQQSNPANALVEKMINCGDSALMLNTKLSGIDPKSDDAPKSVSEAVEKFFDVQNARWINCSSPKIKEISEKFCNVVVTGEKNEKNPNYSIIDQAEGQAPTDFEKTFLALNLKNKVEMKFVQGRYGMGSYGAVNFCMPHGLQLILSKRNPALNHEDSRWGFTLIRRFGATDSYRNSRWKFLKINNEIASFDAKSLKLLPGKFPNAYGKQISYGTFIKLYEYDIGPDLRSQAKFSFINKLNSLLPNPVVPAKIYEMRSRYSAQGYEQVLKGLETKIEGDKAKLLWGSEDFTVNISNEIFSGTIYAFKKYNDEGAKFKASRYENGVLFTLNGQTNAKLSTSFFDTRGLKFNNIKSYILVILDCSKLSNQAIEDIFSPDREKIKDGTLTKGVQDELRLILKDSFLGEFQNEMRKKEIEDIINSNSEVESLLSKLLSNNPRLSDYLNLGNRISNPFQKGHKEKEEYVSNKFPTFFRLSKDFNENAPKQVEDTRSFVVKFETDAPNDYFSRPSEPGVIKFYENGEDISNRSGIRFQGRDGLWQLHMPPLESDLVNYKIEIDDVSRVEPFTNIFYCKRIDFIKKEPRQNTKKNNRESNLDMPIVKKISKINYQDFEYKVDDKDAMWVEESQDGKNIFYLNMDNKYALNYLRNVKDSEIELVKNHYEIAFLLVSMSLIKEHKSEDSEITLLDYTKNINRALSPVMLDLTRDIIQ